MKPRIEKLAEKKLIGQSIEMSLAVNKTGQLWRKFAPRISEIQNRTSRDKISLQIYPPRYYSDFDVNKKFIKWAAVEVSSIESIPSEMQTFILEQGFYAVFDYKGSSADTSIYHYIFNVWIPNSKYMVDTRPHFEVLGTNYKNNDPTSEEEIWIPIIERP